MQKLKQLPQAATSCWGVLQKVTHQILRNKKTNNLI